MSTIIQIKTFMCPNGLGNPNAYCRFHRAIDNLPQDKKCPNCNLLLVQATDPQDKITMTVIGEEDIEVEIEEIKERKQQGKENKRDPDLSTLTKENKHREKRLQDITNELNKAKLNEDK